MYLILLLEYTKEIIEEIAMTTDPIQITELYKEFI
jgi:hypothetical protein